MKTVSEIAAELPAGHAGGIREAERVLRVWLNGRQIPEWLVTDVVTEYVGRTRRELSL